MSVTGVVSQSFDMIKKNPVVLLPYLAFIVIAIICGIIFVVAFVLHLVSSGSLASLTGNMAITPALASRALGLFLGILPSLVVLIAVLILISLLFIGAYLSLAKQIFNKKKPSIGKAFSESSSRYLSMLGGTIIVVVSTVVVFAIFVGPLILSIVSSTGLPSAAALLGFGLLAIIGVILMLVLEILFFQINTLIIIEGLGAVAAVKRSVAIGKRNFWSILGILVLIFIISLVIDIFRIIPIIGAIISLICDFVLVVMSFLMPAIFYYNYVSKAKQKKTKK